MSTERHRSHSLIKLKKKKEMEREIILFFSDSELIWSLFVLSRFKQTPRRSSRPPRPSDVTKVVATVITLDDSDEIEN